MMMRVREGAASSGMPSEWAIVGDSSAGRLFAALPWLTTVLPQQATAAAAAASASLVQIALMAAFGGHQGIVVGHLAIGQRRPKSFATKRFDEALAAGGIDRLAGGQLGALAGRIGAYGFGKGRQHHGLVVPHGEGGLNVVEPVGRGIAGKQCGRLGGVGVAKQVLQGVVELHQRQPSEAPGGGGAGLAGTGGGQVVGDGRRNANAAVAVHGGARARGGVNARELAGGTAAAKKHGHKDRSGNKVGAWGARPLGVWVLHT